MGLNFSWLLQRFFNKKHYRLPMLGLDGSGKTTILYKLKFGAVLPMIPTVGFNVEIVDFQNVTFTIWDVGGQDKLRRLWKHYYPNTKAIIFVVDSTDLDRLDTAADELSRLLHELELQDSVLLVLANKQDLPRALTIDKIGELLQLKTLQRNWHIQGTCALNGDGLHDGFEWLSRALA